MSEKLHIDGSILPFLQTPTASITGRTLAESKHQWRQDPKRLPEDAQDGVTLLRAPFLFNGKI